MYSDISRRTILLSSSNRLSASVFASSVLPTPVGPKNRNEPIGLVGSLMPAFERIIASVTFVTASSCPTTLLCRSVSRFRVFSRSDSLNLATGIPVHLEIIFAISSSVTLSCTKSRFLFCTFFSASSRRFWTSGSLPYCNWAAFSKS